MTADPVSSTPKAKYTLQIVQELLEIAERAFIHKLKKRNPEISDDAIRAAVNQWYAIRPGAELGDGVGVPGDPKRFDK
jgi:Rv0078B-related antitoxin